MREIKFRAWDKDGKRFLKGDFSLGIESGEFRGKYGEVFSNVAIQQFTGLTDKSGKEIYEGDIIQLHEYGEVYKPIIFINGCFCVHGFNWNNYNCSVIGNIYETSEFLTNKQTV